MRRVRLTALQRLSGGLLDETLLGQLISLCNQCEGEAPARGDDAHAWWKAAVVCQVYPRSFGDSDGDGVAGNYPDTDRLLRRYEAVVYRCTLVTNP